MGNKNTNELVWIGSSAFQLHQGDWSYMVIYERLIIVGDFHILQVARLQQMAKKQLSTLGVYRTKGYQDYPKLHNSNGSKWRKDV